MSTTTSREEWQCQYRGSHCQAARAVKDDGSLHHLCPEHRERANLNQRRCKERQRRLQARMREAAARKTPQKSARTDRAAALKQLADQYHAVVRDVELPDIDPNDLGGLPLMNDTELFAPILHDLSLLDGDDAFLDDLFQLIDADLDSA